MMFNTSLLQVTIEQLEWFKNQPDIVDAYDEFVYTNNIHHSSSPENSPGREISFEDYTLSLLMTSNNPPLEGYFSPEEMLFSRALVYGTQVVNPS